MWRRIAGGRRARTGRTESSRVSRFRCVDEGRTQRTRVSACRASTVSVRRPSGTGVCRVVVSWPSSRAPHCDFASAVRRGVRSRTAASQLCVDVRFRFLSTSRENVFGFSSRPKLVSSLFLGLRVVSPRTTHNEILSRCLVFGPHEAYASERLAGFPAIPRSENVPSATIFSWSPLLSRHTRARVATRRSRCRPTRFRQPRAATPAWGPSQIRCACVSNWKSRSCRASTLQDVPRTGFHSTHRALLPSPRPRFR